MSLEEQFIGVIIELARFHTGAGNYQKAEKWLKRGLLMESLHRELNYCLIELLLMTNEKVMAIKHYDIYKKGLIKKLGCEPDEAIAKLLRQGKRINL